MEKRRLRTSSGKLPAPKIACLAAEHPFTQQVDIVFPSNPVLLEALQKFETSYRKGKVRLYDILNDESIGSAHREGNLLLKSHSRHEDDIWCIDTRAHLTICASKDTYESLGLVGQKLPFKNRSEYHLIDIPLGKSASSKNLDKTKSAVLRWGERRRVESRNELSHNRDFWDVLYCFRDSDISQQQVSFPVREEQIFKVQCTTKEMHDVHIPRIDGLHGSANDDPDAKDDWSQQLHSFFEWVGMACLGAQRLYANDRVDPFVAVYDPPARSYIGKMTHLQWKGLLSPGFIQGILDVIVNSNSATSRLSFVGVTSHGMTHCPISYIPSRQAESGEVFHPRPSRVPLKLPKEDGEDTWSLLLDYSMGSDSVEWCLMESIEQHDNRWG